MDDRTLIERAAKAAGIEGYWHEGAGCLWTKMQTVWDPLTKDSDAFRLAVKRRINVKFEGATESTFRVTAGDCREWAKFYDGDIAAATRRAIVRAAASLAQGGVR